MLLICRCLKWQKRWEVFRLDPVVLNGDLLGAFLKKNKECKKMNPPPSMQKWSKGAWPWRTVRLRQARSKCLTKIKPMVPPAVTGAEQPHFLLGPVRKKKTSWKEWCFETLPAFTAGIETTYWVPQTAPRDGLQSRGSKSTPMRTVLYARLARTDPDSVHPCCRLSRNLERTDLTGDQPCVPPSFYFWCFTFQENSVGFSYSS